MTQYAIVIEFDGGCYHCPFCSSEWPRKCRWLQEKIEWRHTGGELTFNPYKQKLKSCPLKGAKCQHSKKSRSKK